METHKSDTFLAVNGDLCRKCHTLARYLLLFKKKRKIMDIARAKEFIFYDIDREIIYISTDLQKLIDIHPEHDLTWVYGVVDTESGEKLFEMDFAYSGEPILMRVFLHKDYFMEYHYDAKVVKL